MKKESLVIIVLLAAFCVYLIMDKYKSGKVVDPVDPDATVETVSVPKLSFMERIKVVRFHKDMAAVLSISSDKYKTLSDFQSIYETSRKLCLADSVKDTEAVGLFVCDKINKKLDIKRTSQLKSMLSPKDKEALVSALLEISTELDN